MAGGGDPALARPLSHALRVGIGAAGTKRAALGCLAYDVAILLAFVSPAASFALDAPVALIQTV